MRRIALAAVGPALAAGVLFAQPWSGSGRVTGTVLDSEGRPFAGARVELRLEGHEDDPAAVATDAHGRYRVTRLAPGSWHVTIDARGHVRSRGRVFVAASEAPRQVDVRLRSLDEVSPRSSEGNAEIVADWIERGDSFLRDGRLAEARAEYAKAAAALPPAERDRVLASLARAQEPGSPAPPSSDTPPSAEPPPSAPPVRPIDAPRAHRTGRYRTSFAERAPESSLDTYAERHGVAASAIAEADADGGTYRVSDESFEVFVPDDYAPGTPHGLFVWISPGPFGGTERPETQQLLAERRLIWIGANASGNGRPRWVRAGLALDAVHNMKRLYDLDPRRIWIGGYSGGGRVASGVALGWPEVFRGGMFLFGCDFYRDLPVPDSPGRVWPAAYAPPSGARRKAARALPLAIVTGTRDFNRASSRSIHAALVADGFERAELIEIPGADHETTLGAERLGEALGRLEPRRH